MKEGTAIIFIIITCTLLSFCVGYMGTMAGYKIAMSMPVETAKGE